MPRSLVSPLLAVTVVAAGLTTMTALSSNAAAGTKLYFHSANSGYQQDAANDPTATLDHAPEGSTLTSAAPTKAGAATARALPGYPGSVAVPTFGLPGATGPITNVCVDVWVQNSTAAALGQVDVLLSFTDYDSGTGYDADPVEITPYSGGFARVTAMTKVAGLTKLTAGSYVTILGYADTDAGWTMSYDSATNPSSITLNATECKGAPVVVPTATASATPTASASATPSASASATPIPSASATATPSGSATATPTASATATPSATPSPTATTPPPPRETSVDYTGVSHARYTDYALVEAHVTTAEDAPVPAGKVEFTLGSVKGTANVSTTGVARMYLPVRVAPGSALLGIRYLGSAPFDASAKQAPITIDRMPTSCAIAKRTTSSGWVITATLKDAKGRALGGQSILFAFDGKTHHSIKTDKTGHASLTVPARHGTQTVTFRTTSLYTGCSASLKA
jgi:hypothetical protein